MSYLLALLVRLVLPASILTAIAIRPYGMSLIYLLIFLLLPFVKVPRTTRKGARGSIILLVILTSVLLLLVHVAWHCVLAGFASRGSFLTRYPLLKKIGYNLGLVSYWQIEPMMAVQFLVPEVVVLITSSCTYGMIIKLTSSATDNIPSSGPHRKHPFLVSAGKYLVIFLFMFCGIMLPSVTSGIYYLLFMGSMTLWSLDRLQDKAFAVVGRCAMAIMAVHSCIIFAYQNTWAVELVPPDLNFARYFGLVQVVHLNETEYPKFTYDVSISGRWATLVSPLTILITYYALAVQCRQLFKPKSKKKVEIGGIEGGKVNGSLTKESFRTPKDKWLSATKQAKVQQVVFPYIDTKPLRGDASETTPLIRSKSLSKRWSRTLSTRKSLHQDATGSITLHDDETETEEAGRNIVGEIITAIIDFFQILIRSSYIATTITMMAWSILYHSWLTFVFLMWANIVWLCQDQRRFMLRTSPVLVVYAMFLLVAQYIYAMDLTEEELPSNITDVNLKQIGLGRVSGEPIVPLLIKSLMTCMFWVTLRQRVQEVRQRRQATALADMAAPLHLTVSTAASEARREEQSKSPILTAIGAFLQAACARYWIGVVAIMLFVIGVTGERMTIFRIIYMFLFLAFLLMFQMSWYWWRRLMYIFWIVVIIYSMIDLILLYIYQFDNFSELIEQYLFISKKLQNDLGLEPYPPADLFVKLLTPTLFLIITIVQVHYFHKDFMQLSDYKSRMNLNNLSSRPSQGASTIKDDIPPLPEDERELEGAEGAGGATPEPARSRPPSADVSTYYGPPSKREIRSSAASAHVSQSLHAGTTQTHTRTSVRFRTMLAEWFVKTRASLRLWVDGLFKYLEINLTIIIFFALMLLCVFDVCAMHAPIMLLISLSLLLSRRNQRFCLLIISVIISVYFMAKMVYQIDYIQHDYFNVTCGENGPNNTNNMEWLGFKKTTASERLAQVLKGYIILIVMFTFHSLVIYRQAIHRELHNLPADDGKLMFPGITRENADVDLLHCIKFLFNYGYYKFGVEVSLICLIGVIGSRMDVYAMLYSAWLVALVSVRRDTQARIWTPFVVFIAIVIPLQYHIAVGVLPKFCVVYPWSGDDVRMKHVRTWLFLPDAESPPHVIKLIFDYLLLIASTLQLRVFRIEKAHGDSYPGGSNSEDIGRDWETPDFRNPVPDFLGFAGTWLDILKRMVFLGMLWVTLAIMFLTGTNRVNLFSIGYLVGSFIFLWQGTDLYLLPKKTILKWWWWLIRYNVCVVLIKSLLQVAGCMFSVELQEKSCWLVQLLGIGCVDKFAGGSISKFLKMEYSKVSACSVPQEDIGLAWDGVCFAFLIVQLRLFHSYYFYRVIDESKATTVLASRGAELIEELQMKQMKLQEEQETNILEKIKIKMEKIKANQKKLQGALSIELRHHDADEESETQGSTSAAPLVRGDSDASGRGYHTPDSPASPRGFHTPLSEPSAPGSPARTPPPAPAAGPPLPPPPPPPPPNGPPSPSSALLTSLSLDAYLEPRRISFGSPPSSELLPRAPSPEESYPVFSPPPVRRRHTLASPSLLQRTSLISQSSRSEAKSHHTSRDCPAYRPPTSHQKAVRSGDYYMFDDFDDTEDNVETSKKEREDADAPVEMGLGELLTTMLKTDLRNALEKRRASIAGLPSADAHHRSRSYTQTSERSHSPHGAEGGGGSKPSSSRRSALDEPDRQATLEEIAPTPEDAVFDKIRHLIDVVQAFVSSLLVSLTRQLMKYSRDYRYVSRTLTLEKKALKERKGFGIGLREGSQMRWVPLPETITIGRKLSEISLPEIRILAPSMERGLDASPAGSPAPAHAPAHALSPTASDDDEDGTSEHESAFSLQTTGSKDVSVLDEQDSMFKHQRSVVVHLIFAVWYAIIAHTDIVCYITVFINQIQSATLLSIPLPLMVFLWGTLTIPRPTKTFWVTLIAYTEVIVLLKSMFQFEMMPWNQKAIPANMPFTAPRIIGIERKHNYALYDLLLLLIIFLHRFMLKSLGLWKESLPETVPPGEKEYELDPEDTRLLMDGRGEEVGVKYVKIRDAEVPSTDRDSVLSESSDTNTVQTQRQETGELPKPPDDHYSVNDEREPIIAVVSTLEEPYHHFPGMMWISVKRYLRPMKTFFKRMMSRGARVTADVYAYMFLCDFTNFLVVIFGFAAFGTHQGDGGVQTYLEENKVPIPFLVMLILQFALIVIDRALYLRKYMLGKILFQYALIIGVHIWMFFVLPFITERTFNSLPPPPMWYMVKCIYLLLSAYQIRCGYPRRIIGNFLCKSYRFLNMVSFRAFMAVPFVFELRTLMDWIWTDTSMTLMDWLKMEDIFANVFLLKCSRYVEDEFPSERGVKKSSTSKYLLGGTVLAFVIAIIWFPLVFFAFGNTVGQPNPPTDVTVKIRIGPYLPVYQMSAQSHNIELFTEQDYTLLGNLYARDRTAQTFLSNYMYNDIAVVTLNPNSTMKWTISPPELTRLEQEAESNESLSVKFTFVITHPSNNAQNPPTIEESREVQLPALVDGSRNPERTTLSNMLTNQSLPDSWLNVKVLFPKFLKVFNKGTAKPAYQLMPYIEGVSEGSERSLYRNVQLRLERENNDMYWRVREACGTEESETLPALPFNNCDLLVMYTFNDKLFPETLNFISGGGIIGLYTTFVFLASRVIRGFFSGIFTRIMFDDLPNVDRVLQLCLDIYLVREALELTLEEDLFAKLVFLYRSPETMIKWSRPKEEDGEQRALPPPPPPAPAPAAAPTLQ